MTKTTDNLKAAFAGESQANRKYLAFARKAEQEGYAQVARLFRAAAHAETIHALSHFRVLGGVGSTTENLNAAISGENYEVTVMYPEFIAAAEAEGEKKAVGTFTDAFEVEKIHEMLFQELLASLGGEGELYDYYVCPVCGYVHKRSAPEKCPVCGALGSKFELIQ